MLIPRAGLDSSVCLMCPDSEIWGIKPQGYLQTKYKSLKEADTLYYMKEK